MNQKKFYLFIAHGSRESSAQEGFEALLSNLAPALKPNEVGGAYLTLNEPSIAAAIEAASEKGFKDFIIAPLFFFEGAHLKNDIPKILADLKLKNSDLDFHVMPAIASIETFSEWLVTKAITPKRN